MVYLQTPSVFHSLMVLSLEPETICLLSAEKATLRTSFVWPLNILVVFELDGKVTQTSFLLCYHSTNLLSETEKTVPYFMSQY